MIPICLIALLGIEAAGAIEARRAEIIPDIPAPVVCEWIDAESSGNPRAVSHTADRGLLQISERYEGYFIDRYWDSDAGGGGFDVFDPVDNATLAFTYLADIIDRSTGETERERLWVSFATYNAGQRIYAGARYADRIITVLDAARAREQAEANGPNRTITAPAGGTPSGEIPATAPAGVLYTKDEKRYTIRRV